VPWKEWRSLRALLQGRCGGNEGTGSAKFLGSSGKFELRSLQRRLYTPDMVCPRPSPYPIHHTQAQPSSTLHPSKVFEGASDQARWLSLSHAGGRPTSGAGPPARDPASRSIWGALSRPRRRRRPTTWRRCSCRVRLPRPTSTSAGEYPTPPSPPPPTPPPLAPCSFVLLCPHQIEEFFSNSMLKKVD